MCGSIEHGRGIASARLLRIKDAAKFRPVVAPHIKDFTADRRDRTNADNNNEGQHHGVLDGCRSVLVAKEVQQTSHGIVSPYAGIEQRKERWAGTRQVPLGGGQ